MKYAICGQKISLDNDAFVQFDHSVSEFFLLKTAIQRIVLACLYMVCVDPCHGFPDIAQLLIQNGDQSCRCPLTDRISITLLSMNATVLLVHSSLL